MADLPQTLPGVPAPGIDPTVEELNGMAKVDDISTWLGTPTAVSTAFMAELGANAKIRDVVFISKDDWAAMLSDLRIPVQDSEPRALKAIERGQLHSLRRIARLRMGLTANEAGPEASTSALVPGSAGTVGTVPGAQSGLAEPKLKLSAILDPSLDSELVRLAACAIRKMFNSYRDRRGAEPAEEIEPTDEQISALSQVLSADFTPYADFSIWGPYGRRFLQKLVYLQWIYLSNGNWQRRELPGPPNFGVWWASYRVLRTGFLLLEASPPEPLDNYGEKIREFHGTYGAECWFIIYDADIKMRSEHFPRLRRHAENGEGLPRGMVFDMQKPWASVWQMVVDDDNWWNVHFHRPAFLYFSRCRSAAEVINDGTVQASFSHQAEQQTRMRSRSPRRRQTRAPTSRTNASQGSKPGASAYDGSMQGPIVGKGGVELCKFYNTRWCMRQSCKFLHACSKCGAEGHPAYECRSGNSAGNGARHPAADPPGNQGGGKRKKKRGRGGKGKSDW